MQISLKGRALKFLAAREHSRLELARKLARHCEDTDEIERVLDDLAAKGLLSTERFVESLVHRRAPRFGTARVQLELRQHGIDKDAATAALASLRDSEEARARAVWRQRFGQPPADAAARAKQTRFLLARGFSAAAVRAALGSTIDDEAGGAPLGGSESDA